MEHQANTAVLAPSRAERQGERTWRWYVGRVVRRQPLGVLGGVLVLLLILAAIGAGRLAPYHPKEAILPPYHAPTRAFVLGTDHLGRDILSRVLWGARLSLYVGLVSVAIGITLGALEAIRSGTTLVLEDAVGLQRYAEALQESGLRLLLCERAWDRARAGIGQPGAFEVDPALAEQGLGRIEDLHTRWHGTEHGRIQVGLAAWAPDMCSPELLRALRDLQERLDVRATIHLNQIWGEVAAVQAQRGIRPTEYLADCDFLSERLIAAHCRCMTPDEERRLGASGAAVAFNAAIAARRGLSPRIAELEAYGCTIALGSDNMAEDMVEVMRTALFMERVRRQDGRHPTPEQTFLWATRHGYRALGVADGGWLTPGNRADLIIVDLRRAHLAPMLRVVSCFVHQGQARDVEAVMVDGHWLMRDGIVRTLDEAAIVQEAERIGRTAWQRLFAERPDLVVPHGFCGAMPKPEQAVN